MRRVAARMVNSKLCGAWNAWYEEAAELREARMAAKRGAAVFIHAKMFAAWNMWRESAADASHMMKLMKRVAMRMMQSAWAGACGKSHAPDVPVPVPAAGAGAARRTPGPRRYRVCCYPTCDNRSGSPQPNAADGPACLSAGMPACLHA